MIDQIVDGWKHKAVRTKVFASVHGRDYTYQELAESVHKMGTLFRDQQLKIGDRVALSVSDHIDAAILFWSMFATGITFVGIDPETGKDRAHFIFQQAGVKGFIVDEKLIESWGLTDKEGFLLPVKSGHRKKGKLYKKLLRKKASTPNSSTTFPAILDTLPPTTEWPTIPASTIAFILFTSGTTANPKGVMLSHHNLFTHLQTLSRHFRINHASKILNILKLYHVDGIVQGPLMAGYNHATWHRPLEFEISQIPNLLDAIYTYRITHSVMVPTILYLIDKFSEGFEDSFETEDFQFIISVSAHLELGLWERLEQKFKVRIVNVYGLSETVSGSFFCGPEDKDYKKGTIGRPIDCEAKIVNEQGESLGAGVEGELLIKGDHVFVGYANNEAATASALQDGWLFTGDLAVADEEGFYNITGRKKKPRHLRRGQYSSRRSIRSDQHAPSSPRERLFRGGGHRVWGKADRMCRRRPKPTK